MNSAPLRERLGLSRSEWARVLNVHERTVGRWEVDGRDPGGTARAVMQGIHNALEEGAQVDYVKRQLAAGVGPLVSATLCLTVRRR